MRDASRRRIARLFARLATKQIAPPSTAPKGLHEKCPAAALRASSNRTSVRPSSRALHLSTFRVNAAPSGFCISLLAIEHVYCAELEQHSELIAKVPAFHPFAIDDAHDADLRHLNAPAGWRQAVKTR